MRLVDADYIKESVKRQCDKCRKEGMKWLADSVERAIIEELDNTPTSQPHWTPCSEKFPGKERVLITMRDGCVTIGRQFDKNDWSTHEGKYNAYDFDVLAWMPLPEPYGGESDE